MLQGINYSENVSTSTAAHSFKSQMFMKEIAVHNEAESGSHDALGWGIDLELHGGQADLDTIKKYIDQWNQTNWSVPDIRTELVTAWITEYILHS